MFSISSPTRYTSLKILLCLSSIPSSLHLSGIEISSSTIEALRSILSFWEREWSEKRMFQEKREKVSSKEWELELRD